jgi:hypothetical protein
MSGQQAVHSACGFIPWDLELRDSRRHLLSVTFILSRGPVSKWFTKRR